MNPFAVPKRLSFFTLTILAILLLSVVSCRHKPQVTSLVLYEYDDNPFENNPDTTGVQISIKLQLPSIEGLKGDKLNAMKKVRVGIMETILSPYYHGSDDPDEAIARYADSIRSEFIDGALKDVYNLDELASGFGIQNLSANVVLSDDKLMVVSCHTEAFTGGIDMMYSDEYLVFDLTTGEQVKEEHLFGNPTVSMETRNAIRDMLVEALAQQMVDSVPELDNVYEMDNVVMNGNFEVKADSLVYHYNPYEVAPPAIGPVAIALPSYRLAAYMNPQSPVYKFWFSK